ncbi:Membrane protein insertase YidC [bacterium HR35]|nr:Membrane protein insertase YidC [bacterium HR35]
MINFLTENFLGFYKFLYSLTNDYGLALILFTFLFRLSILPLSYLVFKEEIKLKKIRPKIKNLMEKHKNDPLKQLEEINKIYQEEKFNPFLSIVFQFLPFPLLIAIFFLLKKILAENKNLMFLGVINLASKNPILIGLTIFFQFLSVYLFNKEDLKNQFLLIGLIALVIINFPAIFSIYWLTNLILLIIEKKLFLFYEEKLKPISLEK